jgi:uncharacterized protein
LSLDGRKEINDAMRRNFSGVGSYDKILPNLLDFAKKRDNDSQNKNYYVRGTFTRKNLDFSNDVLALAELGFKNISVEPVTAPPETDYAIQEKDLSVIFAEYDKLALLLLENPINFFHFNIDLSGGPCAIKRAKGCGAGSEYLAVTPEGDLYPCHQFVGNKDFLIGNLISGNLISGNLTSGSLTSGNAFSENPLAQPIKQVKQTGIFKDDCKKCWAKFFCSGGCATNAYNSAGDINKPYKIGCELMKRRIECSLMIKAKRSLEVG